MKNLISIEDVNGCIVMINPGYVATVRESSYRSARVDENGQTPSWKPTDIQMVSSWVVEIDAPIEYVLDRLKGN